MARVHGSFLRNALVSFYLVCIHHFKLRLFIRCELHWRCTIYGQLYTFARRNPCICIVGYHLTLNCLDIHGTILSAHPVPIDINMNGQSVPSADPCIRACHQTSLNFNITVDFIKFYYGYRYARNIFFIWPFFISLYLGFLSFFTVLSIDFLLLFIRSFHYFLPSNFCFKNRILETRVRRWKFALIFRRIFLFINYISFLKLT